MVPGPRLKRYLLTELGYLPPRDEFLTRLPQGRPHHLQECRPPGR